MILPDEHPGQHSEVHGESAFKALADELRGLMQRPPPPPALPPGPKRWALQVFLTVYTCVNVLFSLPFFLIGIIWIQLWTGIKVGWKYADAVTTLKSHWIVKVCHQTRKYEKPKP